MMNGRKPSAKRSFGIRCNPSPRLRLTWRSISSRYWADHWIGSEQSQRYVKPGYVNNGVKKSVKRDVNYAVRDRGVS